MRTLRERFEAKVIPEPNSGCHLWCGAVNGGGYGQMNIDHRRVLATHIALALIGRPNPLNKHVLHRCDLPACVNPDHLFFGDDANNVADMIEKNRQNFAGLELGRQPKYPKSVRDRAKQLFLDGKGPTAIAKVLGLKHPAVVHGWMKKWGHRTSPQSSRTDCPSGHPYSGDNLIITNRGDRQCRECSRTRPSRFRNK